MKNLTGEMLHEIMTRITGDMHPWNYLSQDGQDKWTLLAMAVNQRVSETATATKATPSALNVSVCYTGRQVFNVWREAANRVGVITGFYEEQNTSMLNVFDAFAADLTTQVNSVVTRMVEDYEHNYQAHQKETLDENDVRSLLRRALELVGDMGECE